MQNSPKPATVDQIWKEFCHIEPMTSKWRQKCLVAGYWTVYLENMGKRLSCSDYCVYYSFKIFPHFWLVKTTCIIHQNQLLLTKFGKNFVILNRWRQNDDKSAWLQDIEPFTLKTWGKGWVVLIRTKWRNSRRNILLVSRQNIVLKHG